MGKCTMSMAIFSSYVSHYQMVLFIYYILRMTGWDDWSKTLCFGLVNTSKQIWMTEWQSNPMVLCWFWLQPVVQLGIVKHRQITLFQGENLTNGDVALWDCRRSTFFFCLKEQDVLDLVGNILYFPLFSHILGIYNHPNWLYYFSKG